MTTKIQIEANRRNATKSTGPRTPKGKAHSSRNALKHGLLAEQVIIVGENVNELSDLEQRLTAEYRPAGVLERELVNQMVASLWRLYRLRKVEAGIFAQQIEESRPAGFMRLLDIGGMTPTMAEEALNPSDSELAEHKKMQRSLGLAFISDGIGANAFIKLSRYEASIERSFFRALHELQRLQAARAGADVSVPVAVDVTVDTGPVPAANRG